MTGSAHLEEVEERGADEEQAELGGEEGLHLGERQLELREARRRLRLCGIEG